MIEVMSKHSAKGSAWEAKRRAVLSASDICWLCGHGGSTDVDHVIPRSLMKDDNLSNLRPAHGVYGCAECGRKCNQERNRKLKRKASRW